MPLFDSSPKSICILRLSAIGDVCNAIAVVQAIQRQWPETNITWITGKLEAQLIRELKNINVIVFDKQQGWRAYTQLWHQIKGHHFDALLHMQYAFRASMVTLGIHATYKLGFDSQRSQDCQTWFTNQKVLSPTKFHVLDGMLAFAKHLGIKDIKPKWSLTYSKDNNAWAQSNITANQPNLVIVPGASKAYKNWNAQGYTDVIHYAHSKGWNVILAGSPSSTEMRLTQHILQMIRCPVTNLVGTSSLNQMLALLDHCDLVIAPDTGPAHMANAMSTPVIGLYAHHNPKRTGPYCYLDYVVSAYNDAIKAETEKELSELNWRTRVKDKSAMNRIRSEQVIQMFDKIVIDFNLG